MRTIYTAGIVNIKKCERAVPQDEEDQVMVPDMQAIYKKRNEAVSKMLLNR